jgi:hypothetical protein
MKVTDTANYAVGTLGAATQCVDTVMPSRDYIVSGMTYVPSGQPRDGSADTRVFFYAGPDCTGTVITAPFAGSYGYDPAGKDTWLNMKDKVTSPAGAVSARVMFTAAKDGVEGTQKSDDPFSVLYDNVSFALVQLATPTPSTPTATATPTKTATATQTASPTATSTASTTATPSDTSTPDNGQAGPSDSNSGGQQQPGGDTGAPQGQGDNGEQVGTLGGSETHTTTNPTSTSTSTKAATTTDPLAPNTGTGRSNSTSESGIASWQMMLLGALGLVAVGGLVLTDAAVTRSEDDEQ